jgi:uncharacterized protein (UPF0371 family)
LDLRIIKSPSPSTLSILKRRGGISADSELEQVGAVGLVQGKIIDMFWAMDIAEKAVGVMVTDVKGNCPQNMLMIAIFGDTAAVEAAMQEITRRLEEGKATC